MMVKMMIIINIVTIVVTRNMIISIRALIRWPQAGTAVAGSGNPRWASCDPRLPSPRKAGSTLSVQFINIASIHILLSIVNCMLLTLQL